MPLLLGLLMGWMLLSPVLTMDAAGAACRLFVQSVLPGLFPYMVFSLMLVSRMPAAMPGWLVVLLGWCGGSPTGARLLAQRGWRDPQLYVMCGVMSPMFLLGTLGSWLESTGAGVCVLASVMLGALVTGLTVRRGSAPVSCTAPDPLSLGEAVESAAKTMLMVCGTMVICRVLTALAARALPELALPLSVLLEVTTGTKLLSRLPLPLPLRAALMAGAAGMGGTALLMQNRSACPGVISWQAQAAFQAMHGVISFGLCLGMLLLAGI